MCFNWQNTDNAASRPELTLEEIRKVSANLKPFLYLTISGGEPTLRDDLPEIVSIFTKENSVQFVTLPTNAQDPQRITRLVDRILCENPKVSFRIVLPFDEIGSAFDDIRGVPGSFDNLIRSFNLLKQLRSKHTNFDIDLNTVLSAYNRTKMKEIIDYARNNFNADNHIMALARGNTRESAARGYTLEDAQEAIRLIGEEAMRRPYRRRDAGRDMIKALKLRMREVVLSTLKRGAAVIPCLAGRKVIMIDDIGDLYPCELLDKKMASLREVNFNIKKALFSPEAKKIKDWIIKEKCFCTFECAMQASIAFNLRQMPHLFTKLLKLKTPAFLRKDSIDAYRH